MRDNIKKEKEECNIEKTYFLASLHDVYVLH